MSNMHRKAHGAEPALPSVGAHQRHLFNEPFVAHVLGLSWPNPDQSAMPPGRKVFDGLGGSVIAWDADTLVAWIIENRPDRVPHLYVALRRHLHRLGMMLTDVEQEFEAGSSEFSGLSNVSSLRH